MAHPLTVSCSAADDNRPALTCGVQGFSHAFTLCFLALNVTANRPHDSWRCMALEVV